MNQTWTRWFCGAAAAVSASCVGAPSDSADTVDDLGLTTQEILNGDTPARGSLRDLGVVRLNNGCTGTLLTNQHVLTARHCIDTWTGNGYVGTPTPVTVTLEGTTPADDVTIASARIFEPNTTTLNEGDFALVELASPFAFGGVRDHFYNPIYAQEDSGLLDSSVSCVGYGNNTAATAGSPGAGFGTLRTAVLVVSGASGNRLTTTRNIFGQIGAPGDSGSTCFFQGQVTGVQSTCRATGWIDANGNGVNDGNSEWTGISLCTSASPGAHRAWVQQQLFANVTTQFSFVPATSASPTATVSSVMDSARIVAQSLTELASFSPRSTRVDATVDTEPVNTMCPQLSGVTPLSGALVLRGTCLNEGLLPVLL